jgi:hypothetical protein
LPLFFHAATWANISSLRSVLLIGANLSTLGGLHKTWLAGGLLCNEQDVREQKGEHLHHQYEPDGFLEIHFFGFGSWMGGRSGDVVVRRWGGYRCTPGVGRIALTMRQAILLNLHRVSTHRHPATKPPPGLARSASSRCWTTLRPRSRTPKRVSEFLSHGASKIRTRYFTSPRGALSAHVSMLFFGAAGSSTQKQRTDRRRFAGGYSAKV